ncbi:MAG: cytochrome c oxidase subunit II [Candidatus Limnocylindrales bacterium]
MTRRLALWAGSILAALSMAGCLPAGATNQAHAVNDLWTVFVVAAAGIAILVWGLITFAIVRYRRSTRDARTMPPQLKSAFRLEVVWTVGPIVLVAFLFLMTLGALGRIDAVEPSRVTIDVNAFRWQWQFTYAGTGVSVVGTGQTPAQMVVPVGEPVDVVLTSSDVVHSFFVPAFLFKRDAIPGHPTEFQFTVETAGDYNGQCAEFCGVYHDQMLLVVHAVSRAEFDAWLAGQPRSSPVPSPSGQLP